jgi:hypothetical protein
MLSHKYDNYAEFQMNQTSYRYYDETSSKIENYLTIFSTLNSPEFMKSRTLR